MESSAGLGKKTIKMARNNACRKKIIVQLQTAHKNAGFKFELQGFNDYKDLMI